MNNSDTASDLGLIQIREMASATQYAFDPASQGVINALPSVHKSHRQATAAITAAASSVSGSTEHGRTALRNGLTYDQFLGGLLYNEETMLASQYLYFDYALFTPEPGSAPRANMTQGRAFLTNHRLLLLSAEVYQGLSLETLCPGQDKKPTGYTIKGRASDVLHYQSIPLSCIHSTELNASVGVQSSTSVFGIAPCCLLSMCSWCGMDSCLKNWAGSSAPIAIASNERTLTMGVTMPPWGQRYMVQLHLNSSVPLTLVKDYIVALSRFAPNVMSKPQAAVF